MCISVGFVKQGYDFCAGETLNLKIFPGLLPEFVETMFNHRTSRDHVSVAAYHELISLNRYISIESYD